MSNGKSKGTPDGWHRVSDYCIRTDDRLWTICKIGVDHDRWSYELWKGKEQLSVGMSTALDAIRLHSQITATSPEAGTKSSSSQVGDQAEQLSCIEAS
jgi:hypothetical protein